MRQGSSEGACQTCATFTQTQALILEIESHSLELGLWELVKLCTRGGMACDPPVIAGAGYCICDYAFRGRGTNCMDLGRIDSINLGTTVGIARLASVHRESFAKYLNEGFDGSASGWVTLKDSTPSPPLWNECHRNHACDGEGRHVT